MQAGVAQVATCGAIAAVGKVFAKVLQEEGVTASIRILDILLHLQTTWLPHGIEKPRRSSLAPAAVAPDLCMLTMQGRWDHKGPHKLFTAFMPLFNLISSKEASIPPAYPVHFSAYSPLFQIGDLR